MVIAVAPAVRITPPSHDGLVTSAAGEGLQGGDQPMSRLRSPARTGVDRCCSPAKELMTTSAPVRVGTAHCNALSCFCAAATSSGVCSLGVVPSCTGTWECCDTFLPRTREYAVTPSAAIVSPVFTTDMVPTPCCAL